MRFEQLKQFIEVAEKGNFRKASRVLGMSQPALSRSIQNLEQYFGVPLFDRLPGGVLLTTYGQLVLDWARETFRSSTNVKRHVDMLSDASTGRLVIGAGAYFDDFLLAIALSRLLERYPNLSIRVVRDIERNAGMMILNRQIDIYLGMIEAKTEDIVVNTFETGPIAIFCRKGHPLLTMVGLDMAAVFKYPFVGPIIPEEVRIRGDRYRYDLTGEDRPLIDIEFDSYAQIRKIVELSDCIGGLPKSIMTPYFNDGSLEELPVSLPDIKHYTSISYLKGRTLLPATEFIVEELTKIVRQRSREIEPGEPA